MPSVYERFCAKVEKPDGEEGCWVWTGSKNRKGYGQLYVDGKKPCVHRVSYWMFVGEIPDGEWIDHLCNERSCVNPAHLRATTPQENILAKHSDTVARRNAEATHCPKGHPYDEENTVLWNSRGRRPTRRCRACIQERVAAKRRG